MKGKTMTRRALLLSLAVVGVVPVVKALAAESDDEPMCYCMHPDLGAHTAPCPHFRADAPRDREEANRRAGAWLPESVGSTLYACIVPMNPPGIITDHRCPFMWSGESCQCPGMLTSGIPYGDEEATARYKEKFEQVFGPWDRVIRAV